MAKNKNYNWLDDPFDPEKEKAELEEMRHAKGCGWVAVAGIVVVILICAVGFGLISSVLTAVSL